MLLLCLNLIFIYSFLIIIKFLVLKFVQISVGNPIIIKIIKSQMWNNINIKFLKGVIQLRKESELIGLPVISKKDGNKIGTIKEVIYSKKRYRIVGFIISGKNFFKEAKIIRFNNVISIGMDALIVKNETVVEKSSYLTEMNSLIYENGLHEKEVLTEEGDSLGNVKDILIDENSGKIIGLILTDGLVEDLKEGRNLLPYSMDMVIGENNIIVDCETKETFYKLKKDYKKILELL